jgi:pimeloyl-ACP methyl ester carboxylesterase
MMTLTMPILEHFIEVGSLKWFYREVNPTPETENTPVILLHGLPSHSYIWRNLLTSLDAYNVRAIAPDWIGSGLSAKPSQREFPYTPDAYCQALGDFLSALGFARVSLIVQGFLGSVGLQYALQNRDHVDRLIILNTPLSSEVKLPWTMKQWGLPLVGEMATQDPLLVDRALEGGSGFVISDGDLAIFRQPYLKTSAVGRSLVATIRNLKLSQAMAEIEKGLPEFDQPILIIWGMADPWLSSTTAEKLARKTGVEWLPFADAKHYPQEHWFSEMNPAIINFLGRKDRESRSSEASHLK